MKKMLFCALCLLSVLCLAGIPFFCTHSDMLPEKITEYYEKKAQDQASAATGAEAELMALLLGGGMALSPAVEEVQEDGFSLSFTVYGLYLLIGAVLGITLMLIQARLRPHLRPALLWTAVLSLPLGLLGARLIYCLSNLSFYLFDIDAPGAMLKIWEGGLSMAGALFFIALSGLLGAKIGKARIGEILDGLIPSVVTFFFFSLFALREIGMGFGPELENYLPLLSREMDGAYRLNTPLLMLFFILLPAFASRKERPAGQRFALFAFLYGGGMILMESLRKDGHMLMGFVHMEMMLDMSIALPALLYLAGKARRIPLALGASLLLAGAVIGLEFALDRAAIGDSWLYLVYLMVISGYLWMGWSCGKRATGV